MNVMQLTHVIQLYERTPRPSDDEVVQCLQSSLQTGAKLKRDNISTFFLYMPVGKYIDVFRKMASSVQPY